jgi:hypothetical protein
MQRREGRPRRSETRLFMMGVMSELDRSIQAFNIEA